MSYEKPTIQDYGSIAEHTYDNPAEGRGGTNLDGFGEWCHGS